MKKIIVPIDFSEHSEYALEAAALLVKKNGGEILALHMLELSDAVLTQADSEQDMKAVFYLKLAEKKFEEFLDKPYLQDVTVTPIVKHFKVFSEVNDVALEHSVDMIVMGSHGASGFSEMFVGSNTEKVVRNATVPVLVVKDHLPKQMFENVVFACDFSEESVKAYINATALFNELNLDIHLLYVNVPGERFRSSEEMRHKVSQFLQTADGNLDNLDKVRYVSDYTVEKGVLSYAANAKTDLIAVSTHGRKGIAHFFEGSISEDLANHSKFPVITFKL